MVDFLTRHLTKPLRSYDQRVPNNLALLKQSLRKGDVVLVEGDQRVSQVIRYLTQSSWSHSALFIGDELQRYKPELAEVLRAEYGEESKYLIIEAEAGEGVICSPIFKYLRYNIRVCRPIGLRREDLDHVIRELVQQIGAPYSVRHILDLARYFFPVSLIPRRFRHAVLHYGGKSTREVICSSMLARAFVHVGYPILPRVTIDQVAEHTGWLQRLLGHNGNGTRALFRERNLAVITPRDFDLSPYFEIVKFNHVLGKFDYRQIEWVNDGPVDAVDGDTVEPRSLSA
jgi:Permuted papain-like amidase enzyme, YaeF/YiiX, C92 family